MKDLQLGIAAHQAGQYDKARQFYLRQLLTSPQNSEAHQLLGLIYLTIGEHDNAIVSLKKSLSINFSQPHVLNNLGVCQKKKGLLNDAKRSFELAITQKKDFLDPHKNLIRLLLENDNSSGAQLSIARAELIFPNNAEIIKLNADYYQKIEEHSTAIGLYKSLVQQGFDSILVKHSLALSLRLSGLSRQALDIYNELEKAGLDQFQFFHNKANALSDLGKLSEAIEYYRKALLINFDYVESHVNLNEHLWELTKTSDYLESYHQAFKRGSKSKALKFSYVEMLLKISQFDEAIEFLDQLTQECQSNYQYYDLKAQALNGVGDSAAALNFQSLAIEFDDVPTNVLLNYTEGLLRSKQYREAEKVVEDVLKFEPENKYAWALLGIAWQVQSDPREKILNDYENLVCEYMLEVPEEFENIEQFCKDLNSYLATLHTANQSPLDQTLIGGTQTRGNLFDDSNPLIKVLVEKIELCINDYLQKSKGYFDLVPAMDFPQKHHFSGSWSSRLSAQGYHTQHIHPMGLLSSAFYVQLPPAVDDSDSMAGWLKLGEPNFSLQTAIDSKKYIKPVVGKLVLFPSYMWHGTIPFTSDVARTVVAFDVAAGERK